MSAPPTPGRHWVVVGAGTAGCVVAARLSDDPDRRVTLLEDGPDLRAGAVPASIDSMNFLDALREPGRTHVGLDARRTAESAPAPYPRGRGVGGSSAVNGMIAMDGDPDWYRSIGWSGADQLRRRVALPIEPTQPDEWGVVDRALLAADDRTRPVGLVRRDGRRVTSAEAYLWPVLGRRNLVVRPESAVTTVLFDGRRATGVRLADGTDIVADRVVLAAGAIHTPVILLRSGVDTPGVGQGLQDHPSVRLTLRLRESTGAADTASAAAGGVPDVMNRVVHGVVLCDDDVQVLAMNHMGADAPGLGALLVALMRPVGGGGTVRLGAGRDDPPVVDLALLDDDRDVVALTRGVRLAGSLLRHRAFADIVDDVLLDDAGTALAHLTDDESIARWARATPGDYVHASGTCAMGTVVDDDGALVGYDGLAVCDASVFPSIPDVNPHVPTTLLAERLCARWTHGHGKMTR